MDNATYLRGNESNNPVKKAHSLRRNPITKAQHAITNYQAPQLRSATINIHRHGRAIFKKEGTGSRCRPTWVVHLSLGSRRIGRCHEARNAMAVGFMRGEGRVGGRHGGHVGVAKRVIQFGLELVLSYLCAVPGLSFVLDSFRLEQNRGNEN